jgi:hypothetical protein
MGRNEEIPTRTTTSFSTQVLTPFGGGYVLERHGDQSRRNLARADLDDGVDALRASMFSEVLKSLRTALYLK